jgi:hypothetical protein
LSPSVNNAALRLIAAFMEDCGRLDTSCRTDEKLSALHSRMEQFMTHLMWCMDIREQYPPTLHPVHCVHCWQMGPCSRGISNF